MQRARSPESKEQRWTEVLAAATDCFDSLGPDLTLRHVAEAAGLTRTTLYGYAATREELLLRLLQNELETWFAEVRSAVARRRTPSGVAEVITERVVAQPRLAPLLNPSARSCSSATSPKTPRVPGRRGSKTRCWKPVRRSIERPEQHRELVLRFLLHVAATVTGLHGVAAPAPVAAKVIAERGLDALRIDFSSELQVAVDALAAALLSSKKEGNPDEQRKTTPCPSRDRSIRRHW